jgi:uncharacterized protein (DUF2141 family)
MPRARQPQIPPLRTVIVAVLTLPLAVEAAELRVAIEGIRSTRGTVMIGLYDNAEGFARAVNAADSMALLIEPTRYAAVALRANAAARNAVSFSKVDPGRYAVIVFHDENNNTKLDRGVFGVPTEPYGFSNNARVFFGAPSFDAAAVRVDGGDQSLTIVLVPP